MTIHYHGPDPAEVALVLALVGLGLGTWALYWVARVIRARQHQRHEEWAMRERLARWRAGAERAAAEKLAATPGPGSGGTPS